jgi:hypothetical protein
MCRTMYKIPKDQQTAAEKGIKKIMQELEINPTGKKIPFHGTRPLAENTKKLYQSHINAMLFFYSLIGDYMSMIILDEQAPKTCPAMDPRSIRLLHRYKSQPKGTVLLDDTGEELLDFKKRKIICTGEWRCKQTLEHLFATIALVHKEKGHGGDYQDRCDECWNQFQTSGASHGCRHHAYNPCLYRKGNPRMDSLLVNTQRQNTRNNADYIVNGKVSSLLIFVDSCDLSQLLFVRKRGTSSFTALNS